MKTHEINNWSKTHLFILYVYLGVKRKLKHWNANYSLCHSSHIIITFQPAGTLGRIQEIIFNFEIFCLQNCSHWVVVWLAILLPLHIYCYYWTIYTIVSYHCKLPGFVSYWRIVKTLVLLISLGFTAFN